MKNDYGTLTGVVKAAGILISAGLAIALAWRGRAKWEPSQVDVPRSPEKIASLLTAVALAVIWSGLANPSYIWELRYLSIGLAIACLCSLIIYSFLIATRTYKSGQNETVIGGFLLTKRAKRTLNRAHNKLTTQQFLASNNYDPDQVWTRNSRALAKLCFLICYIGLTAFGTIALSCASILLLLSPAKTEIPPRRDKQVVHIAVVLNGDIFYTRQILEGFSTELDKLLEPTPYIARYESAIGIAEAPDNDQNEPIFKSLLANFQAKPDYLVTIGTQVSEYAYHHYFNQIPIVFIGVTDPVASGLVKTYSPDNNRGLIAGTLFDPPVDPYVQFFTEAFPGKTFGFVYNPSLYNQDEIYKDRLLREVRRSKRPLVIKPVPVTDSSLTEAQQEQADIFFGRYYVGKHLHQFISSTRKPFITASVYGPSAGALASISTDTTELGRIAAQRIIYPNLTQGIALSSLPVVVPQKTMIAINLTAARKYNISISQKALSRADRLIN